MPILETTAGATEAGGPSGIVVVDSVTALGASAGGRAVVCGSHGGRFPAALAAELGVRGIVLNDAGVGKDLAGIAGLELLDGHGIPAATVGHLSADIGDGDDTLKNGLLSHVNSAAAAIGCVRGMRAADAAELMAAAAPPVGAPGSSVHDARHLLRDESPRVWALDSASLAAAEDAGDILLTGSHGSLLGGRPSKALAADALAAVFNDAGRPAGDVPTGRLAALDERGIAAGTVDANSARIGDGRSTYFDGVLSAVNRTAAALGASKGMTARAFTDLVVARAGNGKGTRR